VKEFVRDAIPEEIQKMQINIGEFLELYKAGTCELLDIRMPCETAVWQLSFGLKIPANALPERLKEVPKDRLIVVACPYNTRSNIARQWLALQGYETRYLTEGLLGLMDHLKGGMAREVNL